MKRNHSAQVKSGRSGLSSPKSLRQNFKVFIRDYKRLIGGGVPNTGSACSRDLAVGMLSKRTEFSEIVKLSSDGVFSFVRP